MNHQILAIPGISILAIIIVLIWGKKLAQLNIDFELTKLGIKLKSDTLTFFLVLAVALIASGTYFWVHGFEDIEERLQADLNKAHNEIVTLENILGRFQAYNMRFRLEFPDPGQIDTAGLKTQIYLEKGDNPPELKEIDEKVDIMNAVWVNLENLNPGDRLRVLVYDQDGNKWECSEVTEIPKASLKMRRIDG